MTGAPSSAPFMTLDDHARALDQRLATLRMSVRKGNPASWDLSEHKEQESGDEHNDNGPVEHANIGREGKPDGADLEIEGPHAEGSNAVVMHNECPRVNRQHLIIAPVVPADSTQLQKHEHNLAGVSLLPELSPFDWPTPTEVAASQQQHLTQEQKNSLQLVDSGEAGVRLLHFVA